VSTGRWSSWAALGALVVLCASSAAWSVSTSPSVRRPVTTATRPPVTTPPRPATVRSTGATTTTAPTATGETATSTPPGVVFTVDPQNVVVGQPIRFSGTGCSAPYEAVISIGGNYTPARYQSSATDGSWTLALNVPDGTSLGSQEATAQCVGATDHATIFNYPTVALQVSTFRHLAVSPGTAVEAGTTLTVSSVGACPVGSGSFGGSTGGYWAEVDLVPESSSVAVASGTSVVQNVSGRQWTASLVVPADTAPGSYVLQGECIIQRALLAFYSPLPITIAPAR
jgi:hypothetical protein